MEQIIEAYKHWLQTLNYSKLTIRNNPRYVAEFITWSKISKIEEIETEKLNAWFTYLSQRPHKRKEGGLSLNYLKSYKNALSQFSRFLRETGRRSFTMSIAINERQENPKPILTREEIRRLYEATDCYPDPMIKDKGLLAARERTILGLFYGCGLRKNEGLHVATTDLLLDKGLLYVRKGKGYKERYVPVTKQVSRDFVHYLEYARPVLLRGQNHKRFLVGWYGSPMKGSALFDRLQVLKKLAGIEKPLGLHTLRHSIATHLLQSGMKLEQIARFLGHSSLESTQIYTHLSAEM